MLVAVGGMTKKEVYDIYVHLGVFGNYSSILGMYFRDTRCCGFILFFGFSFSFFLWAVEKESAHRGCKRLMSI